MSIRTRERFLIPSDDHRANIIIFVKCGQGFIELGNKIGR